tara:strand:- start:463 stop:714 length:252 start_codon:yes stop_codon:yes gene_type:complete
MKITKAKLKQIIKEELERHFEDYFSDLTKMSNEEVADLVIAKQLETGKISKEDVDAEYKAALELLRNPRDRAHMLDKLSKGMI